MTNRQQIKIHFQLKQIIKIIKINQIRNRNRKNQKLKDKTNLKVNHQKRIPKSQIIKLNQNNKSSKLI